MNINNAIEFLNNKITNPKEGLPDELFFYVSRITPLVNVDLLIKDENGRTLLAWRNDQYIDRKGWHIPGGIVRYKETLEKRVKKVAETEIGVDIDFDPVPITINQMIHPERETRGHFVSLLYKCFLSNTFIPKNKGVSPKEVGYLAWHKVCPNNLIKYHEIYYKSYI